MIKYTILSLPKHTQHKGEGDTRLAVVRSPLGEGTLTLNLSVLGDDFRRQILTSIFDPRTERVK